MRYIPLCLVLLAGCASVTPESLQKMSIAEVCYLGTVEPDKQQMVNDEVRRRNEDCAQHKAEIDRISAMESRAAAESGQGGGNIQGQNTQNTQRSTGKMGY